MYVLAGIRKNTGNDSYLALELIEQLLKIRTFQQGVSDPDTQKELTNVFVHLPDIKKFDSYHKKPSNSQTGSKAGNEWDHIPEFRKALTLALNLPKAANIEKVSTAFTLKK